MLRHMLFWHTYMVLWVLERRTGPERDSDPTCQLFLLLMTFKLLVGVHANCMLNVLALKTSPQHCLVSYPSYLCCIRGMG